MAGTAILVNAALLFTAHAQTQGINVTNVDTLRSNVLCPIFDAAFWILMGVSILMVFWASFTYMRAQDDAEKVSEASKTLTYAAVGIVVALCAKAFPIVISGIFPSVGGITSC